MRKISDKLQLFIIHDNNIQISNDKEKREKMIRFQFRTMRSK